jgi:hypothetical protein
MPQIAIQQSKEARRIYLIALEVRRVNPRRADRLVTRVREIVRSVRVLVASREVR